jgi:polyphosphate kinase
VLPVLTPIGLDPAHPFPRILNKSLNFIVELSGTDSFGRDAPLAVVQAPRSLARIIRIPVGTDGTGADDFVFLSSIIHAFVGELFPGLEVIGCHQFRVTRNSDLLVDDEEQRTCCVPSRASWLRAATATKCASRWRAAVRRKLLSFLLNRFGLGDDDLYEVNGPVNLNRLSQVIELVDRPDLKYPRFVPGRPGELAQGDGMFAAMRRGDLLLHHPYQGLAPVVDLLREAAADPAVLAVKQTLYRTGPDSPVVDALVDAARAGKEVTVVVELMARFDEAENIALATRLQAAGAHVVYGVVGYKTHAKLLLVVRRERGRLRRYVHLGTGNYHPETARLYADYGLLSSNSPPRPRRAPGAHAADQPGGASRNQRHGDRAARAARAHPRADPPRGGACRRGAPGAHRRQDERPRRGRRSSRRCMRPHRVPACSIDLMVRGTCCLRPGVPGRLGPHQGALAGRALPRARARVCCSATAARPRSTCRAPTGWSAISSAASRSCFRSPARA